MFISKFWYLLLATIAGAAVTALMLAQEIYNREQRNDVTAILHKDQSELDIALNLFARRRLDALTAVSIHPKIRDNLGRVSSNPAVIDRTREQLLPVLRSVNEELGRYKGDFLSALDKYGKVIAQIGHNEQFYKNGLSGFPLVKDVLRGNIRDDVWLIDSEVFLMAGRPVIHQGQYVGVVLHGFKLTGQFATRLSKSLGAQVAFFHANVLLGLSPSPLADKPEHADAPSAAEAIVSDPVSDLISSRKLEEKRVSDVIPLKDEKFYAIYARVVGEARKNDVMYAVIRPVHHMTEPWEFIEGAASQDIKELPWFVIVPAVLLMVILGVLWNILELERPLKRFQVKTEALQPGENERLNVYLWRGRLRRLASTVNEAIDRAVAAVSEVRPAKPTHSIDSILGTGGKEPERVSSAVFDFAEPGASQIPPAPPGEGADKIAPPSPSAGQTPPSAPQKPGGIRPEPPSKPPGSMSAPGLSKSPAAGATPQPRAPISSQSGAGAISAAGVAAVSPETASAPAPGTPEELEYFKEIHEKFIEMKKKLGEPTENLSFDRFKGTLEKNRDALIARYQCRAVAFKVYDKEGKASLKAIPVRS